jgi:hypothetical protein
MENQSMVRIFFALLAISVASPAVVGQQLEPLVPVCSDDQDFVLSLWPDLFIPPCMNAECGGAIVENGVVTPYGPVCGSSRSRPVRGASAAASAPVAGGETAHHADLWGWLFEFAGNRTTVVRGW